MFLGEYQHSLDTKGRIIMPAKFRDELGRFFIITRGMDKYLFAYSMSEWEIFNKKIKELPTADEGVRRFVRFFFGGAAECESDTQGRVVLPQHLREYAGITKNVVSIGVSNRIEIWGKENWTAYNERVPEIDKELADRMASLGI